MNSEVIILDACLKEIKKFPKELQKDILFLIEEFKKGIKFSMPLSRPMPSIGSGVHEFRLKDRSGQYRVIYFLQDSDATYFVHAFMKKTQKTPKKNLDLAIRRIRSLT